MDPKLAELSLSADHMIYLDFLCDVPRLGVKEQIPVDGPYGLFMNIYENGRRTSQTWEISKSYQEVMILMGKLKDQIIPGMKDKYNEIKEYYTVFHELLLKRGQDLISIFFRIEPFAESYKKDSKQWYLITASRNDLANPVLEEGRICLFDTIESAEKCMQNIITKRWNEQVKDFIPDVFGNEISYFNEENGSNIIIVSIEPT